LLDIGFALNLATGFTIVSLVIVGLFMLAEWLMGSWLASQSHVTNLVVNAGLVVTLGFSSRAIHRRVDHLVGQAFFRKRHEDQQAILEFAREAAFATDSVSLLNGTIALLTSCAEAEYASIALEDGRGCYGDVRKDDPAILDLQTRHRPVDLRETQSAFRGEYAYPMAVGGRLVGVLIRGQSVRVTHMPQTSQRRLPNWLGTLAPRSRCTRWTPKIKAFLMPLHSGLEGSAHKAKYLRDRAA
jgi:hypothetical protein